MRIEYTGRQLEITPDLKGYAEERARKIDRVLRNHCNMHVILAAEKHRRIAEITLKWRDHTLIGIEETADARSSLNGALDKLERQAVRLLAKVRARKRRHPPTSAILLNIIRAEDNNGLQPRNVLETERIAIKPLSVDEALESLDASPNGLVVFRNQETERVNIIYQRRDGKLALIEPES